MKERKVWIDGEFPQVYFDPKTGNESIEGRPFILEDIKTHDRELVKEVCEKIKEQLGFIVDGQERIVCDGSMTGDKTILAILDQIQKEYEK